MSRLELVFGHTPSKGSPSIFVGHSSVYRLHLRADWLCDNTTYKDEDGETVSISDDKFHEKLGEVISYKWKLQNTADIYQDGSGVLQTSEVTFDY